MKRFICIVCLCSIFLGFTRPTTGNLTVLVSNIDEVKGYIQVGLFKDDDNFPTPGKELKLVRFKVTSTKMRYTFKNLEHGDYAVAVYHDKNGDKKCNRNFFGVPTERYGFSRNFKPFLSAPGFDDARVQLSKDVSISIKLI